MDFDSIEGLSEEDINSMYENSDLIGNWFGTWCKTFYNDRESLCANSAAGYTTHGECPITCESTISFTTEAMDHKCKEICGSNATHINFHMTFHTASEGSFTYCHGLGHVASYRCYKGHYHNCHEAAWYYKDHNGGTHHSYFHGRHEHPWPMNYSQCRVLKTR